MILDYLSGPGVITSVLINERGKRDRQRRTYDDGSGMTPGLAFKMEECRQL